MLYSRMIQPSGANEETSGGAGDQAQRGRRPSTLRARRSPPGPRAGGAFWRPNDRAGVVRRLGVLKREALP